MDKNILKNLGPLASMAGIWEGSHGDDVAPSDDRGIAKNKYRERMTLEPIGPVTNHEQVLYGLKYFTTAWRIGEQSPYHEDMGYWLWDVQTSQVIKCFVIPRGISIVAGGTVKLDAKSFTISANEGSGTYGLCHNIFLEKEFKITGFDLTINILGPNSFGYDQDTKIKINGKLDIFHHRDKNTLNRI